MSRKTDIFEAVLTNPYNHNSFVDFVREFLNDMDIVAPTQYKKVYNNFSYYVDGYFHIGNYQGDNGEKIAIFSVALKKGDSVERSRTMQRNFIKPLIEAGNCAGALVAFYTPEEPDKWRLSFIRLDYEFSKGKVTEKLTPAKRYSYLVGKGEPCNTAKQRLFPIFQDDTNNPGIDELEEAFSVEKVTNEFFQLYCEKYHELREYLESNEDFMQEAQIRNFTSEQFAKKLLGQIVFLYFIQKKGWLGVDAIPVTMTEKEYKRAFFARGQKSRDIVGSVYAPQEDGSYKVVFEKLRALSNEDEDFLAGIVKGKPWGTGPKDFMRKMFDGCVDACKNYFDDYLEPLFYTGLNLNRGENGYYPPLHRRIPFLNGGLFEQLDNLDCNIICGNSLMDEFKGIKLITKSNILGNDNGVQQSIFQPGVDSLISHLIELQDKLFFTKEHSDKEEIKKEIQKIYNEIILEQIKGNNELENCYIESLDKNSKPFILWQLYFPKVFKENGGFDAVIGNPPYGLLNKKQNQNESIKANEFELKCYKESDIYKPAKGGMINIFRLFICKSYDILRKDGHLSLIFPMAFMCDLSAAKLRKFVLNKNKIDYLEAFPERDNENKRVFKSAKMSVCILGSSKTLAKEDEQFPMRISTDRFVDLKSQKTMMSRKDIETIDSESLTIPLMTPDEYSILLKICEGSSRMSEYSKCYTGEIDLSLNKKYIHLEDTYARMLRGAQVQKFYTTDNISQGDILFLDSELYLKENKTPRSQHHLQSRIVMQGITGVNEKYRLKMSISKEGEYCANSVNYLMCGNYNLYFLGLLNSHLLNWYFAKLSTNSNVNGYEVDNIPVRIDEDNRKRIEEFVNKMLDNPNDYQSEDELNALVYDIYGLSAREREIVEQRYL